MSANRRPAVARSAARLGAVQALYQMDIAGTGLADVLAEFGANRLGEAFENGQCGPADEKFFQSVLEGVVADQRLIDRALEECLAQGWTLPRLDSTARAILRSAAYELAFRNDVPPKVVISEYVDVARAFFEADDVAFINGVLDTLARKRRPSEM